MENIILYKICTNTITPAGITLVSNEYENRFYLGSYLIIGRDEDTDSMAKKHISDYGEELTLSQLESMVEILKFSKKYSLQEEN